MEAENSRCVYFDCSDVGTDKYGVFHGIKYRCVMEKEDAKRIHDNNVKRIAKYKRMAESKEVAAGIEYEEFFDYCDELDKQMIKNKQKYNEELQINPYCGIDERCLVYIFNGNDVVDIGIPSNVFNYIGARFNEITDSTNFFFCLQVPVCTLE